MRKLRRTLLIEFRRSCTQCTIIYNTVIRWLGDPSRYLFFFCFGKNQASKWKSRNSLNHRPWYSVSDKSSQLHSNVLYNTVIRINPMTQRLLSTVFFFSIKLEAPKKNHPRTLCKKNKSSQLRSNTPYDPIVRVHWVTLVFRLRG